MLTCIVTLTCKSVSQESDRLTNKVIKEPASLCVCVDVEWQDGGHKDEVTHAQVHHKVVGDVL